MLFVVFQLGTDQYAVEAAKVSEILPFVEISTIHGAPAGLAGLFAYRGQTVPAIDLGVLIIGRPAPVRFSTRIILTETVTARGRSWLGMIAEQTTKILQLEPEGFSQSNFASMGSPYLGPIARTPHGLIRRIDLGPLIAFAGQEFGQAGALEAS